MVRDIEASTHTQHVIVRRVLDDYGQAAVGRIAHHVRMGVGEPISIVAPAPH